MTKGGNYPKRRGFRPTVRGSAAFPTALGALGVPGVLTVLGATGAW